MRLLGKSDGRVGEVEECGRDKVEGTAAYYTVGRGRRS